MKRILLSLIILNTSALVQLADATEPKPHLSEDWDVAKSAFEKALASRDYIALCEVVEQNRNLDYQLKALSVLNVWNSNITPRLMLKLERDNGSVGFGGAEDILINLELKSAMIKAIATSLRMDPPPQLTISAKMLQNPPESLSIPTVSAFLKEAKSRMAVLIAKPPPRMSLDSGPMPPQGVDDPQANPSPKAIPSPEKNSNVMPQVEPTVLHWKLVVATAVAVIALLLVLHMKRHK